MADQPTMDFETLRQAGVRQLERLAGPGWTDFNAQDPGITILDQCCYALTELAYRCDFPLPDLLASGGRDPAAGLYSAARILATQPVTLADLRKLAVDVRGVRNAWIERVDDPAPAAYLDREGLAQTGDHRQGLVLLQAGPETLRLPMRGLYRVWIEAASELGVASAELAGNVGRRLHGARPLGMDFAGVDVLKLRHVLIDAAIEIDADAVADDVYANVLLAIARHMSPSVRFRTLAECLAQGWQVDEIFDGPALEQGFIDTRELAAMRRKTSVRVSDLIHAIMAVDGVALVQRLVVSADGADWHDWWLEIEDGYVPAFDQIRSRIAVQRKGFQLALDQNAATDRVRAALAANAYRPARPEELDVIPPAGRDRHVGAYYSIQQHFPENYGLGERGLPSGAAPLRQAQVRQLQAYLLLFDQLLANQFSQLAHLGDLLGFGADAQQTYFAGAVDDPALGLDPLWRHADGGARRERLARIVEAPAAPVDASGAAPDWLRRNRLLDHLLARFAERFVDPAGLLAFGGEPDAQDKLRDLAGAKRAWLGAYPQLSAGRGTGRDLMRSGPPDGDPGSGSDSGLEQRLLIKLALSAAPPAERLRLVEHVLLRPLAADAAQGGLPLLANARGVDPYSLQLTLVMPGWTPRARAPQFKAFVEQTLNEELPAHLFGYVAWLDEQEMAAFTDAHDTWLASQHAVRQPQAEPADWFRYRDARDRIVDLLGVGQTYPLADLQVRYTDVVAWGQQGSVTLVGAQRGVAYELLAKNGTPLAPPVGATGTGADLVLMTPTVTGDVDFALRATRIASSLSRMLLTKLQIKVGLDQTLAATILASPLLDPQDVDPAGARLVDYGAQLDVGMQGSQAGVDYRLLVADPKAPDGYRTVSVADVRGDGAPIVLHTLPMQEDGDLRIRATKTFEAGENKNTQTSLLNVVLPLKVRADPSRPLSVPKPQVDFGAGATVVVDGSQATARYQLFRRDVRDSEFQRAAEGDASLPLPGMPGLWVAYPPLPTLDAQPEVQPDPDAGLGTGADLVMPLKDLKEDCLVVVRATKAHAVPQGAPIASSVQLLASAVVLVRPGGAADFPLRLRRKDGAAAGQGLQKDVVYLVEHGQPGVHYHVRAAGSNQDLGLPVYFHKAGKGIGALAVGIDLVVASGMPSPPPEWDCPADVAPGDMLSIRAVKAQTGLETVFELTAADLLGPG